MNIDVLNKKRKRAVLLSLILTIIILVIFLIIDLFFASKYFIVIIFSIFGLISCLYGLSKFIVMPLYDSIVLEIVSNYLNNTNGKFIFKKGFLKDNLLLQLFSKDKLNITNKILMSNEDANIFISDFIYFEKINKSENIRFSGKSMSFILNKNVKNYFSIDNNFKLTDEIISKISGKYDNKVEYNVGKKYKQCVCYYNNSYSTIIASNLSFIDNSVIIKSIDNRIDIIFIEKNDGLYFKLQNKLNNDINIYCKEKYLNVNKTITTILNLVKENADV